MSVVLTVILALLGVLVITAIATALGIVALRAGIQALVVTDALRDWTRRMWRRWRPRLPSR